MKITIAIDGPGAAGKSTVAKAIAEKLNYALVDTGAIYRAVALFARRRGIAWDDDMGLAGLIPQLDISFRFENGKNHMIVNDEDVSDAIRTPEMSMGASAVSARPVVRVGLLALQRQLAGQGSAVLEGRDIGTVVFPQAQVKFYLDATIEERARRRQMELQQKGEALGFDQVLTELKQRDDQDQRRAMAPLKPADDAVSLDSTQLSIDDVIAKILQAVDRCKNSASGA